MYTSELFSRIRRDLSDLPGYIARIERERQTVREDPPGTLTLLGDYNYATYTEICRRDTVSPDFSLDPGHVKRFEEALDQYLVRYAPGNEDLKCYVIALSLYLTFIAHRPLHPPGVPFSEDIRIVKRGGCYYCTGKRRYRNDSTSLCCFCVCRAVPR